MVVLLILILKITGSPDKQTSGKNNGNNKVNSFCSDSVKYAKKSEKLKA